MIFRKKTPFMRGRRRLVCEALEERIVLNAAVDQGASDDSQNGTPEDNATDDTQAIPGAQSSEGSEQTPDPVEQVAGDDLKVVLISSALDQVVSLAEAATDGTVVLVYNASGLDLAGIVSLLQQLVDSEGKQIGQLAVFSHGDPGIFKLSDGVVFSAHTVESDPGAWQQLGALLSDDARIDLYGCDIGQGEAGAALVEAIAQVTGATVWASDDATGNTDGADWDLEVRSSGSAHGLLIDTAALDGVTVYLDNSDMSNPGFETGDLTGWVTDHGPVTLINADNETYGGWTIEDTPYAADGEWIIRLDNYSGEPGYDRYQSEIHQDFYVATGDSLVFAYNFVTDRDYEGYDAFGYRITSLTSGAVIAELSLDAGDIQDTTAQPGHLIGTGWQEVTVDLGAYVGHDVSIELWAGNTRDTSYPSWGYFDFAPTTPAPPDATNMNQSHSVWEDSSALDLLDIMVTASGSQTITAVLTITDPSAGSLSANDGATYDPTTGTWTITGTASEVNTALSNVTFTPAADYFGEVSITTHVEDAYGQGPDDGSIEVTVIAVSDSPTVDDQEGSEGYEDIGFWVRIYGTDVDLPDAADVRFELVDEDPVTPGIQTADGATLSNPQIIVAELIDGEYTGRYYQEWWYEAPRHYFNNGSPNDTINFTFITPRPNGYTDGAGSNIGTSNDGTVSIVLGDVDNDGDLDLIDGIYDSRNHVYLNDGSGNFSYSWGFNFGNNRTQEIELVDLNNDGWLDVVEVNSTWWGSNTHDYYYLNQGENGGVWQGFASGVAFSDNYDTSYSVAVGDLNGDGWQDIVVGNESGGWWGQPNKIYYNLGEDAGGNWLGMSSTSTQVGPNWNGNVTNAIEVADVDNDGDLDIIAGNEGINRLYLNDGSGGFTTQNGIAIGSENDRTESLAVADVNNDGWLDIIAGNDGDENRLYLNDGTGGFTSGSGTAIGSESDDTMGIAVVDANGDGWWDIYAGNDGDTNKLYLNDGTGNFTAGSGTDVGSETDRTFAVAVGYVDGDTWMDVISGNYGAPERLYLNLMVDDVSPVGTVEILVHQIWVNPSFETGDYTGWTLEDYSPNQWRGVFGIVEYGQSLQFFEPIWDWDPNVNGGDGYLGRKASELDPHTYVISEDNDPEAGHYAAVLLDNYQHHLIMSQEIDIPNLPDSTLDKYDLMINWDMEYLNQYDGAPDPANHFIEIRVTDGTNTVSMVITASGASEMQSYSMDVSGLVGKTVRVEVEAMSAHPFFDATIDDFRFSLAESAAPLDDVQAEPLVAALTTSSQDTEIALFQTDSELTSVIPQGSGQTGFPELSTLGEDEVTDAGSGGEVPEVFSPGDSGGEPIKHSGNVEQPQDGSGSETGDTEQPTSGSGEEAPSSKTPFFETASQNQTDTEPLMLAFNLEQMKTYDLLTGSLSETLPVDALPEPSGMDQQLAGGGVILFNDEEIEIMKMLG